MWLNNKLFKKMEIQKIKSKDDVYAFISGPMTGYDNFNFNHFNDISDKLTNLGIRHVNPVSICKKYKKEDVLNNKDVFNKMVEEQQIAENECNTLVLLNGWENSAGVRLELDTALKHGMKIVLENDIDVAFEKCAVALSELDDEDWKTQLARKYPNIPAGSKVKIIEENYVNFYGGPWTRVKWNGNTYWVDPSKLMKIGV